MQVEGGLFTLGYSANPLGGIMRLFQLWLVAFEQMDLFGSQSHAKYRLFFVFSDTLLVPSVQFWAAPELFGAISRVHFWSDLGASRGHLETMLGS